MFIYNGRTKGNFKHFRNRSQWKPDYLSIRQSLIFKMLRIQRMADLLVFTFSLVKHSICIQFWKLWGDSDRSFDMHFWGYSRTLFSGNRKF